MPSRSVAPRLQGPRTDPPAPGAHPSPPSRSKMALATFRPGPGGPRCRLPPDPPSSLLLEAATHSAAPTVQAFLLRKLRAVYAAAGRRVDRAERPLRAQHRAALPGGGVITPQMREEAQGAARTALGARVGPGAPQPPARPAPPAGPTSDRGPPERHIPAQWQGGPTARGPGWAPRAFTCSAADHHKPRKGEHSFGLCYYRDF